MTDEHDDGLASFTELALSMPPEATATRALFALVAENFTEDGHYSIQTNDFFTTVGAAVANLELRLIQVEKELAGS